MPTPLNLQSPSPSQLPRISSFAAVTSGKSPNPGGSKDPGKHPPPIPCQEKRGIFSQWAMDVDVASQASLHLDTLRLLSQLASTSLNILYNNGTPRLRVWSPRLIVSSIEEEGNSLGEIASRILDVEKKGIDIEFETAINLIQFALKLDFLRIEKKKDFKTLIKAEICSGRLGCTERQGKRWRGWGFKLVEFASAGKSLFLT